MMFFLHLVLFNLALRFVKRFLEELINLIN